jgi:hypothetical protein
LLWFATPVFANSEKSRSNVVCDERMPAEHRLILTSKLKKITGWSKVGFNADGALQVGSAEPIGGSQTARELLAKVIKGPNFVLVEDASNRRDVVFAKLVLAQWKNSQVDNPPAYVVLIDFADFDQIMGDRRALESFNVGWGLLHELEHAATDSADAERFGETGACEAFINQMRRECGLPERAEYFFTFFPLNASSDFKTRFVRLSFVEVLSKKQKRYWLIWDADIVGGIEKKQQIAVLRP